MDRSRGGGLAATKPCLSREEEAFQESPRKSIALQAQPIVSTSSKNSDSPARAPKGVAKA